MKVAWRAPTSAPAIAGDSKAADLAAELEGDVAKAVQAGIDALQKAE